jgi:adenine/guanine phosphoribosyltransferase-like PRPP-binding protein
MADVAHLGSYRALIGSQSVDLPLVPIGNGRAISLLMTIDQGIGFMERAGRELAELLSPAEPEVVASVATLGIPVAIEVSRSLRLDSYLILQKTPKIHLSDALSEPVRSVTTDSDQTLLLDRARISSIAGRRVVLVDDVVATGSSIKAAVRLLRTAGARVVAIGVLLTEGAAWRRALAEDAELVTSLGRIPEFEEAAAGYREVWEQSDE